MGKSEAGNPIYFAARGEGMPGDSIATTGLIVSIMYFKTDLVYLETSHNIACVRIFHQLANCKQLNSTHSEKYSSGRG